MLRIVIIEDNIKLAKEIAAGLESEGHNTFLMNEYPDYLDAFRSFTPDLLIVNVLTRKLDGFAMIAEIKRRYPGMRIIAVTTENNLYSGYYLQAIKSLGVDFTLKKPFRIEHLKQMINFMLNGKAMLA